MDLSQEETKYPTEELSDPQDQATATLNFTSIYKVIVLADEQVELCKGYLEIANSEKESL